ncbi:MAG: bifunctional hydroxymethylpyrimidine kinase/phosphomethylpyrimidine kinase, partial [Christensenellaceae bacterium]|nr:bifunctional hydroxymethylpyrimidine kinase/phosphomethylpyrimidine kinase [Christensenellaceae bacterium]
ADGGMLADMADAHVVLSGVAFKEGQLGAATLNKDTGAIDYAFADIVPGYFHGSGDVFGSSLLAALLNGQDLPRAAATAVRYTQKSIALTKELAQEERYGVCFEKAIPQLLRELGIIS